MILDGKWVAYLWLHNDSGVVHFYHLKWGIVALSGLKISKRQLLPKKKKRFEKLEKKCSAKTEKNYRSILLDIQSFPKTWTPRHGDGFLLFVRSFGIWNLQKLLFCSSSLLRNCFPTKINNDLLWERETLCCISWYYLVSTIKFLFSIKTATAIIIANCIRY